VFSIPYADYLIDRSDKDLSVAHLSCAGPLSNSFQNRGDSIVCRQDRDHQFRTEIHRIPGTPIDFRMAFLPAEAITSATVIPSTPMLTRLCSTASRQFDLTIASMRFICLPLSKSLFKGKSVNKVNFYAGFTKIVQYHRVRQQKKACKAAGRRR
jgi:hypothetical protein